jgi:hypothetical protein
MSLKIYLVPFIVMASLLCCSKTEKKAKIAGDQNPMKKLVKQASPRTGGEGSEVTGLFHAANYTDNRKWLKGIDTKEKNVFIFSVPKNSPTPLTVRCRLQFASAGEAEVRSVYRMEKPAHAAIFIKVDKNLDPNKDGFPNPIFLKGFTIIANSFSKEHAWRNGISLKETGLFFFSIKENEPVLVQVGDRLKFLKTGEAIVKKVAKGKAIDHKFNIMVTVDRALDPASDGFPNPIDVSFNMKEQR